MSTLKARSTFDANTARLRALTPESERKWGQMTPHEMLCHLADSYQLVMGERSGDTRITWVGRYVMKPLALSSPLPWPKGVPTGKTVDAKRGGTRPGDFTKDLDRLLEVRTRFAAGLPEFGGMAHPVFGPMTSRLWGRWAYRHEDHHLRQFSV